MLCSRPKLGAQYQQSYLWTHSEQERVSSPVTEELAVGATDAAK